MQEYNQTSIYVSGEIVNLIGLYYKKFYVSNTTTGQTIDESCYTQIPTSDWVNIGGTWSIPGFVFLHNTFSDNWGVTFSQPGTYEIVASVVGPATVPHDQARKIITVS